MVQSFSKNIKMKALFVNFIILAFLLLASCCKKEKECNPACGPLQTCDDGVCKCKTDQFILGNSCVSRCKDCYEGAFSCGCTDKYVIDASKFELGEVVLNYVQSGSSPGIGSTDVRNVGQSTYKFSIPRSCTIGDKKSTDIEFTVDKSDSLQLKVEARYHILPSNETLEICSAVFTR
jgi:hypothetical protein